MRLAQAISDGRPVDWDLERSTRPELSQVLDGLRLVETVSRSLPAAPGPDPAAARTWGSLRLIERIGRGSFGEVYRAYDPVLQREVALKLLAESIDPAMRRSLLEEARRLARVRHANVLVVHGADEHDGRLGLWTDLLRGRTLEQHLARSGVLGEREIAVIGIDLCRALAAVHRAGLLHRDVKAANVMREDGGRIVLMDFGSVAEAGNGRTALEASSLRGTPLAMAPEVLAGGPIGPAADIYALGVLLYRLASGRYPVEARDLPELEDRHRRGESLPLRDRRPDLSAAFVAAIDRALEADPARRHASAGGFERALARTLSATRAGAEPTATRWAWTIAAMLVLVALVLLLPRGLFRGPGTATGPGSDRSAPSSPAPGPSAPASPEPGAGSATGVPAAHAVVATADIFRDTPGGAARLVSGDRVAPGDALYLALEAPERLWTYVLDEDARGALTVLFPAPGLDHSNPVAPGRRRLPGTHAGESVDWQVTSAGGRETILVLASRHPLPDLEREIAAVPRPSAAAPVVYGRLSTGAPYRLRGITGLVPAREASGGAPRLSDVLRRAASDPARAADLWTWQITLENPNR